MEGSGSKEVAMALAHQQGDQVQEIGLSLH